MTINCDICGSNKINWDKNNKLLSYPAKYSGKCLNCGSMNYAPCKEVDNIDCCKIPSNIVARLLGTTHMETYCKICGEPKKEYEIR